MTPSPTTQRLVGVYNANGGLLGELNYVIGKIKGTAHCALCDISHGKRPVPKKQFTAMVNDLPLPFNAVHLNERDTATIAVMAAAHAPAPAVILIDDEQPANSRVLLSAEALEACRADPQVLLQAITAALT